MVFTAPAFVCTIAVEIQLTGAFYVDQLSIFFAGLRQLLFADTLAFDGCQGQLIASGEAWKNSLAERQSRAFGCIESCDVVSILCCEGLESFKVAARFAAVGEIGDQGVSPHAGCRQRVFRWCLFPVDIGVMKNINQIVATINQGNDVFLLAAWIFRCFEGNVCSVAVILVKLQVEVVAKVRDLAVEKCGFLVVDAEQITL